MGFFNKLDRAGVLFNGMADRLGVNPAPDVGQPAGANAYRTAVLRCSACAEAEACAGWQVEHATAPAAPGYCRNRSQLEALRTDRG